jgi:hypothetical protein
VTLALSTMLARPSSCDRDPHVSVGYINDLISIEGLDYITSAAMQGLLKDRLALIVQSALFLSVLNCDCGTASNLNCCAELLASLPAAAIPCITLYCVNASTTLSP